MPRPMVSRVEIRVAGAPLSLDDLLEVRVEHNLLLPDAFAIRLADPKLEHVDQDSFAPGEEVEIHAAGPAQTALAPLLTGQIVAVEPEFRDDDAVLAVRGYDHSHVLHRTPKSRAFQSMTYADIVRRLASEAGLTAGRIEAIGQVHEFVQQSNETDWRFLWRLAAAVDFLVAVEGRSLHFRPASDKGPDRPLPLRWGESLQRFRPRVSGAQQVDEVVVQGWDPMAKSALNGTARLGDGDASIGLTRAKVAGALGGGTVTVADRPVATADEAKALARSEAARLAGAYVEAEALAIGDSRLRAGALVQIDGVGRRFGGTYRLSATTHVYRGSSGYRTQLTIAGRSPRTLLGLAAPPHERRWADGLVIGTVTNNQDPKKLGRVRVRYPVLGQEVEGWWARIAAPGAGRNRGVSMMPVPGDEVVVGFEHGDVGRPYVLGALWNGRDKPETLSRPDGSFALRSDKELVMESAGAITVHGKDKVTLQTDKDLAVEVTGSRTEEVGRDATLKAKGRLTTEATGPVAIKGAKVDLEAQGPLTIKAAGSLRIQCSGVLQVSASQIMLV